MKPNILLITSDQQRKDSLGTYDASDVAKTPHLDHLCSDGVVFDRAYTPHPTCTPARASMLTGQYASRHGAYTIGTTTPPDCLSSADLLAAAGYRTYAVGKMHFAPVSTEGAFESPPSIMDEAFWRGFDGPYYGFQWTRLLNRHTSEELACRMHYAPWAKDRGLREDELATHFNGQRGRWSLPRELHPSRFVSDHAVDVIRTHEESDAPFFMWASFPDPHPPHVVPAPYDTMIDPGSVAHLGMREDELLDKPPIYRKLFESGSRGLTFHDEFGVPSCYGARPENAHEWRARSAIHHGMVSLMDEEIGAIIDALKRHGLYENTCIIFTSDHGDYLGNHGFIGKGFPAYEEVYNVPFLVKNVGQANAGTRSSALLGTIDIAPTALNIAGLSIPAQMQGVDQSNSFLDAKVSAREDMLIENRAVQTGFYQKMLVTDRHKVVVYAGETYGELYDMRTDPNQYENLWSSSSADELRHHMLVRLCAHIDPDEKPYLEHLSSSELLKRISELSLSEAQPQRRTSFS